MDVMIQVLCEGYHGTVMNVQVPFLFKLAIDWLSTATGNPSSIAEFAASNPTVLAVFVSPAAVLIGYGIAPGNPPTIFEPLKLPNASLSNICVNLKFQEVCGNRTELCHLCNKYIRLREKVAHDVTCNGVLAEIPRSII
ncbi:ABC transporter of the mitochondrion 1 [Artemisia annua]|uniref:ABC transporter of the mitochondrion 1 n=1 Tax=Artemisia annua TaxID=35608 RepID=A0A2U1K8N6_ARTAN|nr:ABC transporter of the mitochondrion 1 [Artemisia annua]